MTPNEAFGEVLRRHRKKKNKFQAEVAFMAGLDRTYISLLELGKRSPTLDTIIALCDALDTKPSDLILAMEKLIRTIDGKS
ncbi:helix-turn-helix domain-containing protein [Duganella sp. LjRoot269]|jgi:transcriptional regulator with XRE-family HTH domain|uniref:helix-turn-helix domain-containing protein n=1 Tax=Duganella sp. LjRoot269 TaxID=3342305 RepID=UPI003ECF0AE6